LSFRVTAMVRAARLPKSLRCRTAAKAVLLALADRCDDDGRNAWPSVGTIAVETEVCTRTAHACLASLQSTGLIAEQAPPRQHRPRTWRLMLDTIAALSDPSYLASLTTSDPTPSATLSESPDLQIEQSARQVEQSPRQDQLSGLQDPHARLAPRATDPVLDPVLLNDPLNKVPRSARPVPDDDRTLTLLKGYAWDVVDELGADQPFGDLTARLKAIAEDRDLTCDAPATFADAIAFALNARRFGVRRAAV
jgi:hypothetical protein